MAAATLVLGASLGMGLVAASPAGAHSIDCTGSSDPGSYLACVVDAEIHHRQHQVEDEVNGYVNGLWFLIDTTLYLARCISGGGC